MSTLIADAGGTSTGWAFINNGEVTRINTPGINPVIMDADSIDAVVDEVAAQLSCAPDKVRFYGAGCRDYTTSGLVAQSLRRHWHDANITVDSDLVGAARALFGNHPGIACILGTGSNSGVYDGFQMAANIPPLGYILGDEGSGASIGKAFINRLFKHNFTRDVSSRAYDLLGTSLSNILDEVYHSSTPNRYLASFCPIVWKLIDAPEVERMVKEQFRLFYDRNIEPYGRPDFPVGFVGSIAHRFEAQLREAIPCEIVAIVADPLDRLVKKELKK